MESHGNKIRVLEKTDFDNFFIYLNKHLSENGKDGNVLFQPVSRSISAFSREKETSFADGLMIPVGEPKWRRAWVMTGIDDEILAHIDLRALFEPYTEHRTLLGMGMLKKHQRKGYGTYILNHAINWAREREVLEQMDLSVLSGNYPALRLYEKAGFKKVCEIPDMFRIDGNSESHTMMTKSLLSS